MTAYILPDTLEVDSTFAKMVVKDYEVFGDEGMPSQIEEYILQKYRIDISSTFAGVRIRNPYGKASGQLSMNIDQVKTDVSDGLGFIVLKTVVAQDSMGNSTMKEWKIDRPQMRVDKIVSKSGKKGWSVSWDGRGWTGSLEEYLEFYKEAYDLGNRNNVPIAASCQFHMPEKGEEFNEEEYRYTGEQFSKAFRETVGDLPHILEVDFSPTLNMKVGVESKDNVLRWFKEVPRLVRRFVREDFVLGIKVFNTIHGREFQREIIRVLLNDLERINYIVTFNRLFDEKRGRAYGGYDLSDNNILILDSLKSEILDSKKRGVTISGTGNICSGKMMVEYALRGATNGQCHTFFQIPIEEYRMRNGSRTRKALHHLIFHPKEGLLIAMRWLEENGYLFRMGGILRFFNIFEHSFEREESK